MVQAGLAGLLPASRCFAPDGTISSEENRNERIRNQTGSQFRRNLRPDSGLKTSLRKGQQLTARRSLNDNRPTKVSHRLIKGQLISGSEVQAGSTESNTGKSAIRFRPCIDIHQGKVKQIVGSSLRDLASATGADPGGALSDSQTLITNFESQISSAKYAEMYSQDNLEGGHVIMLGADPASQEAALAALQAYPGGLQVGGGINPDNASRYLDAGASHVIVTSYVFREGRVDEERLQKLVEVVGKKRLVLDLSCRKKDGDYRVVTDRWQVFSDVVLNRQSLDELAESADEFLVHGVDVEGMRLGIDDELVELLGRWSPIPVTYAGGARTLEDLERVRVAGNGAVDITVGSALDIFGGDLPYRDVVAWHWQQQQ